jgi:hypothetical protein
MGGSVDQEMILLYTEDNYWWESQLSDLLVMNEVLLDMQTKRIISSFMGMINCQCGV